MTDMTAPVFTVREVCLYEREVRLRLPFRFGVVTLTEAPQVFVRARIELPDGSSHWGAAAELLAPKWFDKNLALSHEDTCGAVSSRALPPPRPLPRPRRTAHRVRPFRRPLRPTDRRGGRVRSQPASRDLRSGTDRSCRPRRHLPECG